MLHSSPRRTVPSSGHFAHSGISLQLAIGAESYLAGWDRTANGDWQSILRLTAEQAKAAESLLQKFSKKPEWIGHSKIKLGDAGDKIIRNGTEMDITDSQSQDLGVVHLAKMPDSIKELQEFQPTMNLPEGFPCKGMRIQVGCCPTSHPNQCFGRWITQRMERR